MKNVSTEETIVLLLLRQVENEKRHSGGECRFPYSVVKREAGVSFAPNYEKVFFVLAIAY